jgi:hypothetical protein
VEEAAEQAAVVLERLEGYPLRDVVRRVRHPRLASTPSGRSPPLPSSCTRDREPGLVGLFGGGRERDAAMRRGAMRGRRRTRPSGGVEAGNASGTNIFTSN